MKLKVALSTATAIGLLTGAAQAGDGNKAFSIQQGQENLLSVDQDGDWNVAGKRLNFTEYLGQFGDSNSITVNQEGNWNRVANTGPSSAGAIQNGDQNVLIVDQTSSNVAGSPGSSQQNGHVVNRVRQTGTIGATATTNSATITQELGSDPVVGGIRVASHYVGNVVQMHTGGDANVLTIMQSGAYSHWYGGGQNNRLVTATQNGSGNEITVTQKGAGPVLNKGSSGLQQRGPSNVIDTIQQAGADNAATVTQDGFQNYVESVSQGGIGGNIATLILNGDFNGATGSSGDGHPAIGTFTSGRGAEAAGAGASSVSQTGTDNLVDYTANGDSNQFGFYQNGSDNQADNIVFNGGNNELGVYQDGTNNTLTLAAINDSDNVFGVKQQGTDNTASISSSGGQNGGYASFAPGSAAEALASSKSLTAGLLEQNGTLNQVSLTISGGGNNVFASLQDNTIGSSTWNMITATQSGSDNQAAVVQQGDQNITTITQTGGNNNASIQQ